MAARFVHSILAPNQDVAADGDLQFDLPVNPLSCIYLNLSPLNETSTIANYTALLGLLSALDRVRVTYRGASVIDIRGDDLVAFLIYAAGIYPRQSNLQKTDNDRRSLVLPIPLSRRIWTPSECFPETRRGELQLTLTLDIADTGFDDLRISIETLELLDANPTHFQRITTLAQTFAATGDNDIDLPIGNIIRSVLAFGTTGFAGATPAPTIDQIRLLKDNIENGYAASDWEVSRAVAAALGREGSVVNGHLHRGNFTTATEGNTGDQLDVDTLAQLYTHLDYDPTRDDTYSLETKGAGRVHLRVNAGAANAARFIVVEKVAVSDFIRPAGEGQRF